MASNSSCALCDHDTGIVCDECQNEFFSMIMLQHQCVGSAVAAAGTHHLVKYNVKKPMRDSSLTGTKWIWEIWHGHDDRFFQICRMRKSAARTLIGLLVTEGGMTSKPKSVTLEESLAIFLQIAGQGVTYTTIEERVQRSSETISNHFHMVLDAVCKLGKRLIKPLDPHFQEDPPELVNNKKAWPHFRGCIGAIDGTHIGLHVPDDKKVPWMNRKGVCTTNVLAICDFSMCIIFATVGMEGSMHDARVLEESMSDPRRQYPFPPEGKYYLGDAGYPLMPGLMTPYRCTRYHLSEFKANRVFNNHNEAFNYRHSSLRSVIERTFGVLKKRWRILYNMPIMSLDTQIKIIWACITLHNFIRRYDDDDLDELKKIREDNPESSTTVCDDEEPPYRRGSRNVTNAMEASRNNVRTSIVRSL